MHFLSSTVAKKIKGGQISFSFLYKRTWETMVTKDHRIKSVERKHPGEKSKLQTRQARRPHQSKGESSLTFLLDAQTTVDHTQQAFAPVEFTCYISLTFIARLNLATILYRQLYPAEYGEPWCV